MPKVIIEAEIDLNKFTLDEIVDHIEDMIIPKSLLMRLSTIVRQDADDLAEDMSSREIIRQLSHRNLTKAQRLEISNIVKFGDLLDDLPQPLTMINKMKYDLFVKNIEKFKLEDFENFIK